MVRHLSHYACLLAGILLLGGCQSRLSSEQIAPLLNTLDTRQHYIASVPFYPQQDFYCGPTTLSEVFNFYGHSYSPDDIAPQLFIPEREGSLQLEMISATRQHGLLPYAETGNLQTLLQLLRADIPVIVLQNLSIPWFPQWHYALVTGYDIDAQTLRLHTGVTPDHVMSFALFEKTWARGGHWLLAPLKTTSRSDGIDPFVYIGAAYDMMTAASIDEGLAFMQQATTLWPDDWRGYFFIANAHIASEPSVAASWFAKGFQAGKKQAAYVNNYAYVLAELGCRQSALEIIADGLAQFPDNTDLITTQQEILQSPVGSQCKVAEAVGG